MWTLVEISECVLEECRHRHQMRTRRWPIRGVLSEEVQRAAVSFAVGLILKKLFAYG